MDEARATRQGQSAPLTRSVLPLVLSCVYGDGFQSRNRATPKRQRPTQKYFIGPARPGRRGEPRASFFYGLSTAVVLRSSHWLPRDEMRVDDLIVS